MPTLTDVANLALDHIGEPYISDYDTDTGTTAEAVRLLLPHCRQTLLEGHVWAFATAYATLEAATVTDTQATLAVTGGITGTAATGGLSGNAITLEVSFSNAAASASATGNAITLTVPEGMFIEDSLSGIPTPDGRTACYINANLSNGKPFFTAPRPTIYDPYLRVHWRANQWEVGIQVQSLFTIYAYSTEDVATPDLVTTWLSPA